MAPPPFLGLVSRARGSAERNNVPAIATVVGLDAGPPQGVVSAGFRVDTVAGTGLHGTQSNSAGSSLHQLEGKDLRESRSAGGIEIFIFCPPSVNHHPQLNMARSREISSS